jgi:glycosyltransferase involved in cell wall biosynthesis
MSERVCSQQKEPYPGEAAEGAPPFRLAVILPCLNEAASIARVVTNFKAELPSAKIFVIDNGSTDGTGEIAAAAGAEVLVDSIKGKGHAVNRAFNAIDADIYVLADGDGTYDESMAPHLVAVLQNERLDMVVATRRKAAHDSFPAGHEWGNQLFNGILHTLFGSNLKDSFSGYRVLSGRYVRSFPALSSGFEIETEMTIHAVILRMPVREVECDYRPRPVDSPSKLKTYRDGFRIIWTIVQLLRLHRPLLFFSVASGFLLAVGMVLFFPVFAEYLRTGLVPRFPTLIVAVGLAVSSLLLMTAGLILDATARSQLEMRKLIYLNTRRPPAAAWRKVGGLRDGLAARNSRACDDATRHARDLQ